MNKKKEIKKLKKKIKKLYSMIEELDHIIAGDQLKLEEVDKGTRLQIGTIIKLLNSHSDKINGIKQKEDTVLTYDHKTGELVRTNKETIEKMEKELNEILSNR